GQAEAVLDPPASNFFSTTLENPFPKRIDLLLRFARDEQRDGRRELELRSPVEGDERLAGELEGDVHDGPFRRAASFPPPRYLRDPRVGKERSVVLDRLFGVPIEPEVSRYFLRLFHGSSSSVCGPHIRGVHRRVGADLAASTSVMSLFCSGVSISADRIRVGGRREAGMSDLRTVSRGLALGESPRWHGGRLWCADSGAGGG